MKYRKKPVVIEAIQFTGTDYSTIQCGFFMDNKWFKIEGYPAKHFFIETLEGVHRADVGDWIIKGVKGEFYTCKPDIFEMTYGKAEETETAVHGGRA